MVKINLYIDNNKYIIIDYQCLCNRSRGTCEQHIVLIALGYVSVLE